MGATASCAEVCGCSTRVIIEVTHYVEEPPVVWEGGVIPPYELRKSNWDPATESPRSIAELSTPLRNRAWSHKLW